MLTRVQMRRLRSPSAAPWKNQEHMLCETAGGRVLCIRCARREPENLEKLRVNAHNGSVHCSKCRRWIRPRHPRVLVEERVDLARGVVTRVYHVNGQKRRVVERLGKSSAGSVLDLSHEPGVDETKKDV